jgi:hypothetical protein
MSLHGKQRVSQNPSGTHPTEGQGMKFQRLGKASGRGPDMTAAAAGLPAPSESPNAWQATWGNPNPVLRTRVKP